MTCLRGWNISATGRLHVHDSLDMARVERHLELGASRLRLVHYMDRAQARLSMAPRCTSNGRGDLSPRMEL